MSADISSLLCTWLNGQGRTSPDDMHQLLLRMSPESDHEKIRSYEIEFSEMVRRSCKLNKKMYIDKITQQEAEALLEKSYPRLSRQALTILWYYGDFMVAKGC